MTIGGRLAARHLTIPTADTTAYRGALLDRFANPRIQHLLAQMHWDGCRSCHSGPWPVYGPNVPAGRLPAGGIVLLAGWLVQLPRRRRGT